MKILTLHCDYITFKPLKKALKNPEELNSKDEKEKTIKECLVIFTAVEKQDEGNKEIVEEYIKNIKDISSQVKAKNIVLYPYAHLSSNLSNPDFAVETMKQAEKKLEKEFSISRAPFGYYKEFELKCKGHPLSELSRNIGNVIEEKGKNSSGKIELNKNEAYDYKQLLKQISRSKLDTSKLKENDHRILGQKLDLFSFNEVAPGMVFFHNKGLIIYNELINFWREEHRKAGYEEISTPQILDKKLWQISGHWEKYKDNIFLTGYEDKQYAVKPMNCPGGMLVFKHSPKSYKDLPLRVAELGIVHRQELSGVLAGLFRVIKFTQDDAHIFCTEEQIESEIDAIMNLIDRFYKKFNLSYRTELSTRPEKRIGDEKIWDKTEAILEKILKKKKMNFKINKGDGAFYGPKIDFHIKDSLGREWQCATIQLDMSMPERFELAYTDNRANQIKRPIMLHRVVYGAIERFMGVLLEHLNGNLPIWLSPIQLRVVSFTDRNQEYSKKIIKQIAEEIPNIRIDADFRTESVPYKIHEAIEQKIPYIIVIGDEEKDKSLAVRTRGSKGIEKLSLKDFCEKIKKEIEERI